MTTCSCCRLTPYEKIRLILEFTVLLEFFIIIALIANGGV